jgi:8-oxo-dGTP pyrophosphatase MutT (NUDIX family)
MTTPPALRDAATVMLVRDRPHGPEVFMLRRTLNAAFVGGFYVFPGGAVDPADRHPDVEPLCDGLTDREASFQLSVESGGLAYWVAAIRECFEEAGVLLATNQAGEVIRFDHPDTEAAYSRHRHAVHDGDLRLVDLCRREQLRLIAGDIHYVSHWITPVGEPRRFDTRFFVARAPDAQEPLHDDNETIASLWMRPADALDRQAAGELQMITPTLKNLEFLAESTSVARIMAAAAAIENPPTIRPELLVVDGKPVDVLLPGEAGYGTAS